jgi:dTDP-4-dehydrorhamnose reductase
VTPRAQEARARGVTVDAVTVWALLGSYDWDSLLTRDGGHYEPGAFDLSSGSPRPTPLANVVAQLAEVGDLGGDPHGTWGMAPLGWWRAPDRFDPAPA